MELERVENFKVAMTSLQVAEITGKQHSHIMRDIRDEISKLGEEIGQSIFGLTSYTDKSNRQSEMYNLSRDGAMQLGARYDATTRYKMIQRINELEQIIGEKEKLLLGLFSGDVMVVANSHKALVELEKKPLIEKIEQDKPLVEFANQVSCSSDSILVREFCKILADENIKIGQNKLYEWLRDNGFVLKGNTEPTQKSINMELFECIERVVKTPYGDKITITSKITGKGQIYFTEKLRKIYSK